MRRSLLTVALAALLAGCGGDAGDGDGEAAPEGAAAGAPAVTVTVYGTDRQRTLDEASAARGFEAIAGYVEQIDTFDDDRVTVDDWADAIESLRKGIALNGGVLIDFAPAEPRALTLTHADGRRVEVRVTHVLAGPVSAERPLPRQILVRAGDTTWFADKYGSSEAFEEWVSGTKLED